MEDSQTLATTLIVILLIASTVAVVIAMRDTAKKRKEQKIKDSSSPPKKIVKLFSSDGELLYEYKGVYLSHWDTNIYHLSFEYDEKVFIRIDKGENMLLTSENYFEEEKS